MKEFVDFIFKNNRLCFLIEKSIEDELHFLEVNDIDGHRLITLSMIYGKKILYRDFIRNCSYMGFNPMPHLRELRKKKYINKIKSSFNSREFYISLTEKSEILLEKVYEGIVNRINKWIYKNKDVNTSSKIKFIKSLKSHFNNLKIFEEILDYSVINE